MFTYITFSKLFKLPFKHSSLYCLSSLLLPIEINVATNRFNKINMVGKKCLRNCSLIKTDLSYCPYLPRNHIYLYLIIIKHLTHIFTLTHALTKTMNKHKYLHFTLHYSDNNYTTHPQYPLYDIISTHCYTSDKTYSHRESAYLLRNQLWQINADYRLRLQFRINLPQFYNYSLFFTYTFIVRLFVRIRIMCCCRYTCKLTSPTKVYLFLIPDG